MLLTGRLKTCLGDIEFLEKRWKSLEIPYLEQLFVRDKGALKSLLNHMECRARSEKMWDESLWRRIRTEDAIWSTWKERYKSPDNLPQHAGSIENEKRISDFEKDLQSCRNRREILRQEIRQHEVRDVPEAARRFKERRYGVVLRKQYVRYKSILIRKIIRSDPSKLYRNTLEIH